MLPLILMQFLICVYAGPNVVITTNGKSCVCGRSVTLTCTLKEFKFAVEWLNENDPRPISKCIKNQSCNLNPDYFGKYMFKYDKAISAFNLTIKNVTKKDNGRKLVCSDGSNSDYHILKVRDYELRIFEGTKNGSVTAQSGCFSKGTNVSFTWIKIDASYTTEIEFEPKERKENVAPCSDDSECGRNEQTKHVETISAKRSGIKKKYYLKVAASYGNERIESLGTEEQYTFEEEDEQTEVNGIFPVVGLIVIAVVITILATITAIVRYIYYRHEVGITITQTGNFVEEVEEVERTFFQIQISEYTVQDTGETGRNLISALEGRKSENEKCCDDTPKENEQLITHETDIPIPISARKDDSQCNKEYNKRNQMTSDRNPIIRTRKKR